MCSVCLGGLECGQFTWSGQKSSGQCVDRAGRDDRNEQPMKGEDLKGGNRRGTVIGRDRTDSSECFSHQPLKRCKCSYVKSVSAV